MTATIRSLALAAPLAALAALLAAAALSLAPAAADGHIENRNQLPDNLELVLSIEGDSDNIIRAGDEFTVNTALRFTTPATHDLHRRWLLPSGSEHLLRISGELTWETSDRQKLALTGGANLITEERPFAGYIKAFDHRTIITRTGAGLNIYDAWTKQLAGTITRPTGSHSRFGNGTSRINDSVFPHYSGVTALWHETDSRAWLFVGSSEDTVGTRAETGQVYVFRLDWGASTARATLVQTLTPPMEEVTNHWGNANNNDTHYGSAVSISRDGSTLAVAAENMNRIGAVYVYTRPDEPGQSWGDISYAKGVKVTPVIIPSLGTNAATLPFTPSSTGRTGASTDCDAWCSRVSSLFLDPSDMSQLVLHTTTEFGIRYVGLSADGRVLTVGAPGKGWSFETPGGSLGRSGWYYKRNQGEVYVWVAPEGGWDAAPRADMDADGNPKTLIRAQVDARNFDPAKHYSPGPIRRITEPDAVLVEGLWTSVAGNSQRWFGEGLAISPDGTTIFATGTHTSGGWAGGAGYIFQQSSVEGWQALGARALNDRYMTPTATFSNIGSFPGAGLTTFNGDGNILLIGMKNGLYGTGRQHVLRLPADGAWASLNAQSSPDVLRRDGVSQAIPDSRGGSQLLLAHAGGSWLADSGCTAEAVGAQQQVTCPLTLSGAIVAPIGTPDGSFTISGTLTAQVVGVADSAKTARGELEVTIGDVVEVAEARLGPATDSRGTADASDDRPFPTLIEPGGKTRLRLQVLNGSGKAAGTGSVTSVLITTTLGRLSSLVQNGACIGGGTGAAATTCAIPAAALTADNSDALLIELAASAGQVGPASVWATVVGKQGETLRTERLTIQIVGPPAALAIAEPAAALLGYDPDAANDPRNRATLTVSASDAGGNRATVPSSSYSARLTNADGRTISSQQAEITWPLRNAAGALVLRDDNPLAQVTIKAGAAAPLAVGEYTLELSAGSGAGKLTATQALNVVGGAAQVVLALEPSADFAEGDTITVTATVTDANGDPMPDGTPVLFTEGSAAPRAVLVLAGASRRLTVDGEATTTLQVVGQGNAWIKANADTAADLEAIIVAAPPAPPSLTDTRPNSFTAWTNPQGTTASALLAGLDGIIQVRKLEGDEWIGYGVVDNREIPGSVDFLIDRGDVLWLDGE